MGSNKCPFDRMCFVYPVQFSLKQEEHVHYKIVTTNHVWQSMSLAG